MLPKRRQPGQTRLSRLRPIPAMAYKNERLLAPKILDASFESLSLRTIHPTGQ
jgi:hypothetical protein